MADEGAVQQRRVPTTALLWTGGVLGALLFMAVVLDVKVLAALAAGLEVGAVYALVGLGVALVYKASKVLNFAQGEFATVGAFVAWIVLAGALGATASMDHVAMDGLDATTAGLPKMLFATLIAVAVSAGLAIVVNVGVVGKLANKSPVNTLVATVGMMLLLVSVEVVVFAPATRNFPRFVAGSVCFGDKIDGVCQRPFELDGIAVQWNTIVALGVLAVAAFGLAAFFRTPVGVSLLATAQDPFAAELQGVSVKAMNALAWGMAGGLAALGGILGAGVFNFVSPGLMTTTFMIPALVGAVLGGLTSMPGAVLGGLLLGVTVSLMNQTVLALEISDKLPGPPQVATFAVLVIALIFRPRGLFGKEA